jgi:hypothetical protein
VQITVLFMQRSLRAAMGSFRSTSVWPNAAARGRHCCDHMIHSGEMRPVEEHFDFEHRSKPVKAARCSDLPCRNT